MSTIQANAILDASGGNTTTINGVTPNAYNTMGKNRIINGAMEIDQRNAGASVTLTNGTDQYCVDRYKFYRDVGGTFTAQQSSTAPAGFSTSMVITASTGASPSASQLNFVKQDIEGFNVADLKWGTSDAKDITISFWIRSSVTGAYAISVANNSLGRSYVTEVTVSSANTWEQKSVTIPGDTSGTWTTNNTAGIRLYLDLGSGSDYNATVNTWASAWDCRTSSSVTWGATTGATLYITGVQLEVGSVATEFERRPYGTELQLCQRYFQKIGSNGGRFCAIGSIFSPNQAQVSVPLPTKMRSSPSTTFVTATTTWVLNNGSNAGTCSALTTNSTSPDVVWVTATTGASLATASCAIFYEQASTGASVIHFSAEL